MAAKRDNDDLADALSRMMSGEHEPEPETPDQPVVPPTKPARPARIQRVPESEQTRISDPPPSVANFRKPAPVSAAAPVPPPRAARPQAPTAPVTPPVAIPPSTPEPPPAPQAPVPQAPAPRARPAAPRPAAPSSPNLTPPAPPPSPAGDDARPNENLPDDEMEIVDDGDAVIVPAPPPSVFAAKPKPATPHAHRAAVLHTLGFKRTMVPILLTGGVLLPLFGALKFLRGDNSPFSGLPTWVMVLLLIAGAILLAFGVMNMLQIRQQLDDAGKGKR